MTLSVGTNLGLLAHAALGEPHYDEQTRLLRGLDLLTQGNVIDKDLTAPPGSPTDGAAYIVKGTATGAWAGHENKIARWTDKLDTPAWEFFTPKAGWRMYAVDEKRDYRYTGTAWVGLGTIAIHVALGNETSAVVAGTAVTTFRMPHAFTVTSIRAELTTAQTSGSVLTVDVNEAGVSILSPKLIFDNTEDTTSTASTAPTLTDSTLAENAKITFDVDQVGDGTATGLKVVLVGYIPV